MPDTSQLASGPDSLQVILVKPLRPGRPQLVQILWPTKPTVVDAAQYPNTAATIMRLLAEASVTLAATKVHPK